MARPVAADAGHAERDAGSTIYRIQFPRNVVWNRISLCHNALRPRREHRAEADLPGDRAYRGAVTVSRYAPSVWPRKEVAWMT